MAPLELDASPRLYPIAILQNVDSVQFFRMTEEDYASHSFHDERMLGEVPNEALLRIIPWEEVARASSPWVPSCDFIFHISHCGSTLLSRLLGCHPEIFSLREPAILRGLADVSVRISSWDRPESAPRSSPNEVDNVRQYEFRRDVFLKLWSRTFRSSQRALIKTTSFVSEMAPALLAQQPTARAILIYIDAPTFLKALSTGTGNDIRASSAFRWERLHRYLRLPTGSLAKDSSMESLSAGELIAMSWLTEMLALQQAGLVRPESLWVDFDTFLANPEIELKRCFAHLGKMVDMRDLRSLCSGPLMARYSKAPQFQYNQQTRNDMLAEAAVQHADEIRRGLDWLASVLSQYPQIQLNSILARTHSA